MKYLAIYMLYVFTAWYITVFIVELIKKFVPTKYDEDIEEFHNNTLATVTILGGIFLDLTIAAKVIEVMK